MPSDDRDPVDLLAEEFAERLRRGERPSVDSYAKAHPELAEQIRQVLPAVAQMEQLKQFRIAAPAANSDNLPDRLGDFHIVGELGRGGMGVVYEAIQESLGRRVALKVLSSHSLLDPERRERFIREAKAAARLHHTNIVPVFGVGEHGGLPYYAMQLIPGSGLNSIVNRWKEQSAAETKAIKSRADSTVIGKGNLRTKPQPTALAAKAPPAVNGPVQGDWNFIAGIGVQAAGALHYAHHMGVLHRDVKPANLLLDDRGEVWVVDFGLAKLANFRGITVTGHVVGTLQYMAPECLNGTADARSDVYGLGATLYELLTLSSPFDGDSPAQIMKRIGEAHLIPPRRINPQIPRDLETIVLKALSREPKRRYSSAKKLADDLQAFLEDRPIEARRETMPERVWRWSRHHPAVAALSCCTAAALILAAALGWTGYVRTKAALESEAKKRDEAEAASAKLEANLELSLAAFEKVFVAVGGDDFRPGFGARGPGAPPPPPGGPFGNDAADKAAVLEAVLAFYDKFAEQNATNSQLRFEAGKAHRRVGEMHQLFNRSDKAAPAFIRSLKLLESVQEERGEDPDIRYELMLVYSNMPVGAGGAEAQLVKAAEFGSIFTSAPRRWALGTVYLKLGWARELAKKPTDAETAYADAAAAYAVDAEGPYRPLHVATEQALSRQRQAALLAERGQVIEAKAVLNRAAEELRPMAGGGPPGRFIREALAAVYQQLSELHTRLGEKGLANQYRFEAMRLQEGPVGPGGPGGPFPKGPPKGPPPK